MNDRKPIMLAVEADRERYLDLLLDADPSREMIDRYLYNNSTMFIWMEDDTILGEAVIDATGEIKNFAVIPPMQGRGYGRRFLNDLALFFKGTFPLLTVGTSESGVEFYQKCGFVYFRTEPDFFTINYPKPIIDQGVPCRDMVYLRRDLT